MGAAALAQPLMGQGLGPQSPYGPLELLIYTQYSCPREPEPRCDLTLEQATASSALLASV
jgi:hypothetical protein